MKKEIINIRTYDGEVSVQNWRDGKSFRGPSGLDGV